MQHNWNTLIRRMSLPLASLAGVGATLSTPARADIYIYRDRAGVIHFTDTPTRPRYKVYPLFKSRRRSTRIEKYFKDSAEFDRLIVGACRRSPLGLLAIVLPSILGRLPLTSPMVLVGLGMLLGLTPLPDDLPLSPQDNRAAIEHITAPRAADLIVATEPEQ